MSALAGLAVLAANVRARRQRACSCLSRRFLLLLVFLITWVDLVHRQRMMVFFNIFNTLWVISDGILIPVGVKSLELGLLIL